ncbi:MAG: hypothetical protein PUP92_00215 [Rhizonema sp. PD38]|nr:hypothetical protein [Rhizonema sp. PD38]
MRSQAVSVFKRIAHGVLTIENALMPKSKGTEYRKKVQQSCVDEQSFFKAWSRVRLLKSDRG